MSMIKLNKNYHLQQRRAKALFVYSHIGFHKCLGLLLLSEHQIW